jgi:hypothetical protein
MRSYALFVLLAGCGFHVHGAGTTGDAPGGGSADAPGNGSSDAPLAIDAAPMIDAAPDSPNDTDGDGVPDLLDNCPNAANADQRDHDIDGRGDVCDLCPHITEVLDIDTDNDGVGDACDPRPTTAGDSRLLWVGFYDANDIVGWPLAGTWAVSNGHLTGGANNSGLQYIYPPTPYAHAYAETLAHFNTLANATGSVSPGAILYTGDSAPSPFYQCELAVTQNGANVYAIDAYPMMQNHSDQQTWTGTAAVGSEAVLHDGVVGTTHTCKVTQGLSTVSVTQAAGATNGVVALGSSFANVSFDYLFIVAIGQ